MQTSSNAVTALATCWGSGCFTADSCNSARNRTRKGNSVHGRHMRVRGTLGAHSPTGNCPRQACWEHGDADSPYDFTPGHPHILARWTDIHACAFGWVLAAD